MVEENKTIRRFRRFLLLLAGAIFLFFACERHEIEEPATDFGYEYFPLAVGKYWEYQVDSVIFDPAISGTAVDSSRIYFRDIIVDTLADNNDMTLYRVERFERTADSLPWEISKVYTMSRSKQQAFLTEDNLKFIKLVFPPENRNAWNGIAFFDQYRPVLVAGEQILMFGGDIWESKIVEKGVPETLPNGLAFDNVLTVSLVDDTESFRITYRKGLEKYAPDAGLIYRRLEIMDTQCQVCCPNDEGFVLCEALSWPEKAEKGFIMEMQLTAHN